MGFAENSFCLKTRGGCTSLRMASAGTAAAMRALGALLETLGGPQYVWKVVDEDLVRGAGAFWPYREKLCMFSVWSNLTGASDR